MRRVYGLGLVAMMAATGCSSWKSGQMSGGIADTGMTPATAKEWAEPYSFGPAKRNPAQIVKRPTYHWESDTLKVPVTPGAVINHVYNVIYTQFSEYVVREPVERMVPTEVLDRWEPRNDAVLACDTEAGAGKSDSWNAFYSAKAKDKPQALDNAVHGIGVATAKKLIDAGYFHEKPHTWKEFQDEIKRAESQGLIAREASYEILFKNRQENMTKLGYNTQLTGACTMVAGDTYYVPVYVIKDVRKVVMEDVPHKDVITRESRSYPLSVSGQKLQAFETDTLVFSFDHDSNNVSLAPAYYNNYSLSFQGSKLIVVGSGRKAVPLPSDVIVPGAVIESAGGMARFSAAFNQKYLPKSATDGHLMVSMQVHSCKQGLFAGSCAVFGRDEQVQGVVVKEPVNGLVKHEFPRASKRVYWVHYWVNTSGSPWYSKNVVSSPRDPSIH